MKTEKEIKKELSLLRKDLEKADSKFEYTANHLEERIASLEWVLE